MVKGIWGKLIRVNLNDQLIKNEFLSIEGKGISAPNNNR